ncbi:hypothetical protein J4G08_12560 [Candidatus Poribacteria bacterium]|nr:hypothetical protein [Candidatus Poribacteria bacterium]
MISIRGFLKGKTLYKLTMLPLVVVLLVVTVLQINIYGDHSSGHICEDPNCDGSGQWGYNEETGSNDLWIQCDICNSNARPVVSTKAHCSYAFVLANVRVDLDSLQYGEPGDLYIGPGMVWVGDKDKQTGRIAISITEGWSGQWGFNLGRLGVNIGERRKVNKIGHQDELADIDWFPGSTNDASSEGRLTGPGGEDSDKCFCWWTWDEYGVFDDVCG